MAEDAISALEERAVLRIRDHLFDALDSADGSFFSESESREHVALLLSMACGSLVLSFLRALPSEDFRPAFERWLDVMQIAARHMEQLARNVSEARH